MQTSKNVHRNIHYLIIWKDDFWMRSVILIKWSEISKVIAQGSSAQSQESVGCPQMMDISNHNV